MGLLDAMFDNLKFFPKDIIDGKAEKPGDRFTAFFFGSLREFEVVEENFSPRCFYAKRVEE